MQNPTLFYKSSGKFSPLLVLAPIVVMPLTMVIAFIYTYASIYIPIVGIVTIILLAGFAFAAGVMCYASCSVFKVRNMGIGFLFGLLIGIFALHASWVTFVYAYNQRFIPELKDVSFMTLYFNPQIVWFEMKALYEHGWFSIGRSSSGSNVSGVFLGICWVIEGGVILVGPIAGALIAAGEVFCERCNAWTEEVKGIFHFNLPLAMAAVPKIEERGFSALQEVAPGDGNATAVARLDADICRTCKKLFALNVVKVEETTNDKGEVENKEDKLISGLLVNEEQYNYFRKGDASVLATADLREGGYLETADPLDGDYAEDGEEVSF